MKQLSQTIAGAWEEPGKIQLTETECVSSWGRAEEEGIQERLVGN